MIFLDNYYVYKKELTKEQIIEIFVNAINASPKFKKTINEDLITFNSQYLIYPFIEGNIKNLDYLIVRDGKEQSGVIDAQYSLASKDFILNNLSAKSFDIEEKDIKDYPLINQKTINEYDQLFIEKLLEKTTNNICIRHNLYLSQKVNAIDIAPIREFHEYKRRYYLENVYLITYYDRHIKKTYKSLYSPLLEKFYYLDFLKSEEYEKFYKRFKRPIVYIPDDYKIYYYDIAFDIYLKTEEELKYIESHELYNKLRKNVKYHEYTKYRDYLGQLIFYYRRRGYLSEFNIDKNDYKSKIFYSYLTLKYNEESGYILANYVKENLVDDDYVKLLTYSFKLGNSFAKKALYEYYSNPRYYNENIIKRYS